MESLFVKGLFGKNYSGKVITSFSFKHIRKNFSTQN